KGYIGGQVVRIYLVATAWKYRDVVAGEYVFVVIPLGKRHPIVGSNKQNERTLRLVVGQSLQGKEFSTEDMAQILMENYETADNKPLPHDVAIKDAEALAQQWRDSGIIE
ncbi:MAG: hypothetical protein ACFNM6_06090, partial [Prevotella sp.]